MDTALGVGSYADQERVFPLWPRPDAQVGNVAPSMGTLRLGVKAADGKVQWLDELREVTATFRPGYTEYQLADAKAGWKACLASRRPWISTAWFAASSSTRRCRWSGSTAVSSGGPTRTTPTGSRSAAREARITEPNLPNGLVLAGWDGQGEGRAVAGPAGQQAEFAATRPARRLSRRRRLGRDRYDRDRGRQDHGAAGYAGRRRLARSGASG